MSIILPNIREIFVPDPGFLICDADLSGADAQVVAWEAEDEDLKTAFRKGVKIHAHNARAIWPEKCGSWSDEALEETDKQGGYYWACKRGVHGTNYGASSRTVAAACGWTIREAERFQHRWMDDLHPGIRNWHRRVQRDLAERRSVKNRFGFRMVFFDRIEQVFPEALAWVPQSTVAITTFKGALRARRDYPRLQFLLQVHDSLVFQIPLSRRSELPAIVQSLHVPIPYPDPLTIPWGVKTSEVSWGAIK